MPVVLYLQQLVPALLDKHVDLCGACIQAVLQHLLEGGGWALDDFACSNAVHNGLIELANDRRGSGRRHAARRHALSAQLRLAHVALGAWRSHWGSIRIQTLQSYTTLVRLKHGQRCQASLSCGRDSLVVPIPIHRCQALE